MSESITISGTTKDEKYASLIPQIKALAEGENDSYAALGNIIAALKYGMNFFWVGLYIVKEKGKWEMGKVKSHSTFNIQNSTLVLGPFQGPVACTRIAFGKGVCGTAWKTQKTIIVKDVDTFEGHIACSSETKSEIVLPVFNKNGEVIMVLDADSEHYANFDEVDEKYLKEIVNIILRYEL
jgi:L-methionine (R)-S-oxide reductase